MNHPVIRIRISVSRWARRILVVAFVLAGTWTHDRWFPVIQDGAGAVISSFRRGDAGIHTEPLLTARGPHAGHKHPGHDDAVLELSHSALRNIGIKDNAIQRIRFQTYRKMITVPAAVVEQPGRTHLQVATPMTGAITHVHAVEGEAVQPGTLLFRIQLTHNDLVKAQTRLVHTLGTLDVEKNEIARLQEIPNSGAVAGRFLLEHEYAKERLAALLRAQRESLRLHGLSEPQLAQISKTRRLLGELQVFAPSPDNHSGNEIRLTEHLARTSASTTHQKKPQSEPTTDKKNGIMNPLILQELKVHKGQAVDAGQTLCVLADLQRLYIEGVAFESDVSVLRQAWRRGWHVSAVFHPTDNKANRVDELEISWLANEIEPSSRTLRFYVDLPNQVVDNQWQGDCQFVDWKYFPGQRLKLQVPAEEWPDRIVLPIDAVAAEGAEYYVFRKIGTSFERLPVHVEYRDRRTVVIASGGTLLPGDTVATRGAHQMQMALRNKASVASVPHTGHSH